MHYYSFIYDGNKAFGFSTSNIEMLYIIYATKYILRGRGSVNIERFKNGAVIKDFEEISEEQGSQAFNDWSNKPDIEMIYESSFYQIPKRR
jgi:hypothetical protein